LFFEQCKRVQLAPISMSASTIWRQLRMLSGS
jgi:hypothetical protein